MSLDLRLRVDRGAFTLEMELELPGRGVIGVLGPSGCGKTTLLRALAGLDRHEGARLVVGDRTWQDAAVFVPPHRRDVGYVFQEPSLFPHLDVRRNLEYGLKRVPAPERRVSLNRAVDLLDLGGLLDRRPDTLSGGERQRAAIARALAASPRLLLMDEPLASLDEERRREVLPYLESLHRELALPVVYVSHAVEEVARLADHLVMLRDGRVEAAGPAAELFTRLDLPLASRDGAEALVEAVVAEHDDAYGLVRLEFDGGVFTAPGPAPEVGEEVRLRVAARDVSLALARRDDTSILNVVPATVEGLTDDGGAQATVRLRSGSVVLLARVTRRSAEALELAPGREVFAQVKSVALIP